MTDQPKVRAQTPMQRLRGSLPPDESDAEFDAACETLREPKVTAPCPGCGRRHDPARYCSALAAKVTAESPSLFHNESIDLADEIREKFHHHAPDAYRAAKRALQEAFQLGAASSGVSVCAACEKNDHQQCLGGTCKCIHSGVSSARDLAEGLAHQVLDAERRIEALTDALQQLIRTWRWRGSPKDNADEYWAGQKAQLQICADELDDVLKAIGEE